MNGGYGYRGEAAPADRPGPGGEPGHESAAAAHAGEPGHASGAAHGTAPGHASGAAHGGEPRHGSAAAHGGGVGLGGGAAAQAGDTAARGGEATFLDDVADRLATLPGVRSVALGGSRAQGTARPDSDWDLAVYYRDGEGFDPAHLRAVGWPGEVSEIGAWGGGVFNGGAWLDIAGHRVDVHYRDIAVVEHELNEAQAGRFHVEPLMFHLAGIPSYLVVAELAVNQVLRGEPLPRPEYPAALRASAPRAWWNTAQLTFGYAEHNHAAQGRMAQTAGLVAQAASQAAHAVLAARGEWVTNEKSLLSRAGLHMIDTLVADAVPDPSALIRCVAAARSLCQGAVSGAIALQA